MSEAAQASGLRFVVEGETSEIQAIRSKVEPLAEAGATWWLETRWGSFDNPEAAGSSVQARIAAGPPRSEGRIQRMEIRRGQSAPMRFPSRSINSATMPKSPATGRWKQL